MWPGLPQLWRRGSWPALAVAAATAVLLNLALLATFGWSELIASQPRRAIWVTLAGAWVTSAVFSLVWDRRLGYGKGHDPAGDAFGEALDHYLKEDWFQAERTLRSLITEDGADLDARMMLATLLRHTGRLEEGAGELGLLARLEGAQKWQWEIRRERELLGEAKTPVDTQDEEKQGEERQGEERQDAEKRSPNPTDPPAQMIQAA